MRKQSILISMVAALVWSLMLASAGAAPQAPSTTKKPTAATPAHHATAAHASTASLLKPETLKLQAPAVFHAKFTTTRGDFVVEVTRAWAPRGADRFYNLVKYHFFDSAAFFRVVPGFVVQFGISPRPDIARVWQAANIPDDPVMQGNARGTLTFATAGPNTRTTQLFINLGNNANLDGQGFSPFGKVTSGMEVVDQIYSEYGESPDQGRIQGEGKAYLDKEFPKLDTIKTAVVLPIVPVAPSKPATAATSKPAAVKH
jgi:peptidyl-prolyl cis-trans isomerase A (cyclophilin A)